MDPTKAQTQAVFAHLKAQKANKVGSLSPSHWHDLTTRHASTVEPRTPPGQV
jgi:hypothetical protein